MVLVAYTVVDPRAVVVHLKDTTVAQGAMMSSRWFWEVTELAVTQGFLANTGFCVC